MTPPAQALSCLFFCGSICPRQTHAPHTPPPPQADAGEELAGFGAGHQGGLKDVAICHAHCFLAGMGSHGCVAITLPLRGHPLPTSEKGQLGRCSRRHTDAAGCVTSAGSLDHRLSLLVHVLPLPLLLLFASLPSRCSSRRLRAWGMKVRADRRISLAWGLPDKSLPVPNIWLLCWWCPPVCHAVAVFAVVDFAPAPLRTPTSGGNGWACATLRGSSRSPSGWWSNAEESRPPHPDKNPRITRPVAIHPRACPAWVVYEQAFLAALDCNRDELAKVGLLVRWAKLPPHTHTHTHTAA